MDFLPVSLRLFSIYNNLFTRRKIDFLPVRMNGVKVYAGFWKRFRAGVVDGLIIIPLVYLFLWLKSFNITLAIAITILSTILFMMYSVFFNARFGGTLGKLAVGIRITKPDGSRIGWTEAWKRSSVDLGFAFIILIVQVWALTQVDPMYYASHGWLKHGKLLREYTPAWYSSISVLQQIWLWSEVIVLLFNKRKRAIHDFIAGTVVIHKEFVDAVAIYNKLPEQKDKQLTPDAFLEDMFSEAPE